MLLCRMPSTPPLGKDGPQGIVSWKPYKNNWSTLNPGESLIGNALDGWELGGRPVPRTHAKNIV